MNRRFAWLLGIATVLAAATWWNWGLVAGLFEVEVELDEAKQEYIWDAEHATFAIESRFGKAFKTAWNQADRAALGKLVREECRVTSQVDAGRRTKQHVVAVADAAVLSTSGPTSTSAVDLWLSLRGPIEQLERSRLRVLKIKPLDSGPGWQARVLFTAVGRDAQGRPVASESEHVADFRFQADDDLTGPVIAAWRLESLRHSSSPAPLMREITRQAGLDRTGLPDNWTIDADKTRPFQFQIAVADYDGDGDLDIAAATYQGRPFLLVAEDGPTYHERSESLGIKPWRNDGLENPGGAFTSLTGWIDYDNDGFPDLLMGNRLYHNERGQRFQDVTDRSGLTFQMEPMGCTVVDYDSDGLLDLYVLYQRPYDRQPKRLAWIGDDLAGVENQLWRNEGGGRFRNVTAASNAGGGMRSSFAASWFFYDDDHRPDVYIANDFGKNVLLRNRGDGTFEDVSEASGASDYATSMGVATGDLNNDGHTDIYVANMYSKMGERIIAHVTADDYPAGIFRQIQGSCAGNRLYMGGRDHTFHEISREQRVHAVGWAYAPAMADFDNDGWLDLYATTGFMSFDRRKPDG